MANKKYLDQAGLRVLWDAIKAKFIDEAELTATLANYVTSIELAQELAGYVKLDTFNAFADAVEARAKDIEDRQDQAEIDIAALQAAIEALPEYTIKKQDDAGEFAAVYRLMKGEVAVGDPININKDQLLKSVTIKTCTEKDKPISGLVPGDKYIDFEFETITGIAHSYLAVKDMVTPYTAGAGIEIDANNRISVVNKTDRLVSTATGNALIFNESDGGGAKFEHADGSEAFVGVNADGKNGMMAQIYADVQKDGKWSGSRINVYNNKIFYQSQANTDANVEKNDANLEIATVGDVAKKTEKQVEGTAGTALMFNEADGGGAKFTGKNNVVAYVGTHDNIGGEIGTQIYVDKANGTESTIIDVTQNGAYYTKGTILPGSQRDVANNEIATIGDVLDHEPASMTEKEIEDICK